jgi:hypothetical protein
MAHARFILCLPVALAMLNCGGPEHELQPLAQSPAERTAVPEGRMFHVRLLERLSSQSSHAGQSFEAITVASVQAADGARLVPAGATVRGHVIAANAGTSTLRIKFDSIETERGLMPLRATLAPIQRDTALSATSFTGPGSGYDISIAPPPPGRSVEIDVLPTATDGVTSPAPAAAEPKEVALEVDTTIRLLLTAPLGMGW